MMSLLTRILVHLILNAVALYLAARYVGGISIGPGPHTGLVLETLGEAAAIFAVMNAFAKPIMKLIALPIMILTLGAFTAVINAGMLLVLSAILPAYSVGGFQAAAYGALLISAFHFAAHFIVRE